MERKALMFIDGSNLFHVLRSICVEKQEPDYRIDFTALHRLVCNVIGDIHLMRQYYFTSAPREIPEPQQHFFHRLEFAGMRVIVSELHDTHDGYREKGVDVNIACTAIKLSHAYDVCMLLTHDQDLIPVADTLREMGKEIVLVSYRDKTPARLLRAVDETINMATFWDVLKVNGKG